MTYLNRMAFELCSCFIDSHNSVVGMLTDTMNFFSFTENKVSGQLQTALGSMKPLFIISSINTKHTLSLNNRK